jgi:hypothetical protein
MTSSHTKNFNISKPSNYADMEKLENSQRKAQQKETGVYPLIPQVACLEWASDWRLQVYRRH